MTYIQKLNGETIDLDEKGIRTKDFIIGSPAPEHNTDSVLGMPGTVDLGTNMASRDITCLFKFASKDYLDFGMIRDEIFNLLKGNEAFYLIEKRNPGKRWLVKTASTYTIPQTYVYGDFEISFVTFHGLSESVGKSIEPQTFDAGLWQIGQGLMLEDNIYEFDTTVFEVFNAGTETVNPRNPNMEILIEVNAAASSYIELINKTTNETYCYDGKLTTNDTLRLDGIRSTKNSLSVYRDTNRKLITLVPGFNKFEVKGTSNIKRIAFDFRFYYS